MLDNRDLIPVDSQQNSTPIVSLRGIWKIFDGVAVLRSVSIDLKPCEIHALLGGNGSGKSTLMKILSGIYAQDAGSMELNGSPIVLRGPAHSHEMGIYMVPQEPQIFPHLSVEENLLMGTNFQPSAAREQIKLLADELGFVASLSEAAGSLSIANQQLLEIIRGLLHNVKVLILDEPTSSLTFREVDSLFGILRKLTARGIGIFFISHRLNEIIDISDRVSVLRDGNVVLSQPTTTINSRDLIRAMLPESTSEAASKGSTNRNTFSKNSDVRAPVVLEVKNLEGEMFHNISFSVRAGEVVGLAGLVGAGRTELAQAILGIDPKVKGEVWINGKQTLNRSPRACQDLGLAYLPEDRHLHGIFLELPNMLTTSAGVLPSLGKVFISEQKEQELADRYIQKLQIKVNSLDQLARTLSGGNQQKVVLSKVMAGDPTVVLLDEPTRGVDAKARLDVYDLIRQLTDQGVGIVLISSDLEEVTLLSDQVLVMFHGVILEKLAHSDLQIERITSAAFGITG